jgi:hypothetical protein
MGFDGTSAIVLRVAVWLFVRIDLHEVGISLSCRISVWLLVGCHGGCFQRWCTEERLIVHSFPLCEKIRKQRFCDHVSNPTTEFTRGQSVHIACIVSMVGELHATVFLFVPQGFFQIASSAHTVHEASASSYKTSGEE